MSQQDEFQQSTMGLAAQAMNQIASIPSTSRYVVKSGSKPFAGRQLSRRFTYRSEAVRFAEDCAGVVRIVTICVGKKRRAVAP